MSWRLALAVCLLATPSAALRAPLLARPPARPLRTPPPRLDAGAAGDDERLENLFASQRKRVGIGQSAPVRYAGSALLGLFGEGRKASKFYASIFTVVPVHQALLALTLAAYAGQSWAGRAAVAAGARMNYMITRGGQWHRLVSPMFLHGSTMHLFSNCYSLWRLGPLAEQAYGPARLLLIYLLSGIGGNVAGLWFGDPRSSSVGASGAVFGIMGAIGAYAQVNRRVLGGGGEAMMRSVGQLFFLNLFIGLGPRSGIDNLGHVGGFVTGALVGLVAAPDPTKRIERALLKPWMVKAALLPTLLFVGRGVGDAVRLTNMLRRRLALG